MFILFLVLLGVYFIGPRVKAPDLTYELPEVPTDLNTLKTWIDQREKALTTIKPGNASTIVFNDSIPQKTKYSILYLHGFSSGIGDGEPVHREVAKAIGANIYLPRLYEHGLDEQEALLNFTAEGYWKTALEAFAVAKQLGEEVIILANSTGATLALNFDNDPAIAALVFYSPNIAIFNPASFLLSKPWGLQIARIIFGGKYFLEKPERLTADKKKYWSTNYRLEALTHIQKMIEVSMNKQTFQKVTSPLFMGYFYKNESIQDNIVSVSAMLKMYDQLGTPDALKTKKAFPDAAHGICNYISNPGKYEQVTEETLIFLNKILK